MRSRRPEPVPKRALRALFPLAVALGGGLLYPEQPWWIAGMTAAGLLGAVSVVVADATSTLQAWQRRFPRLSFRGVRRFPQGDDGHAFDGLCAAVSEAQQAARDVRPEGRDGRLRRREMLRDLRSLLQLGADLAVQIETLDAFDAGGRDDRVAGELARARARIEATIPAAHRLRDALIRSGRRAAAPDGAAFAAVLTLERDLHARADAAVELGELP